ncbi:MAG: hypothetical protein ACRDF4_10320, partial [Rhabdochlamydiaceae bacterium]
FLLTNQLQREAVQRIHHHLSLQLHASCTNYHRTVLTAAAVKHAAKWMTVLPTQPAYRLDDESFRLAVRHRLGVPPSDTLPLQPCVCSSHASFRSDPDHLHSCNKSRGAALIRRHNALVDIIAKLAQECGFTVTKEPLDHIRPEELQSATTSAILDLPAASRDQVLADELPAHYNRHGDLLLHRHQHSIYIDVACTRPTNPTHLHVSTTPTAEFCVQTRPLAATHRIAQFKTRKYKEICEANQYQFYPFIIETYGGLHAEGMKLLELLSASHPSLSQSEFLRRALSQISVALQIGNANTALLGQEKLHLLRHRHRCAAAHTVFRTHSQSLASPRSLFDSTNLTRRIQPQLQAEEAYGIQQLNAINTTTGTHRPLLFTLPTTANLGDVSAVFPTVRSSQPNKPQFTSAHPTTTNQYNNRKKLQIHTIPSNPRCGVSSTAAVNAVQPRVSFSSLSRSSFFPSLSHTLIAHPAPPLLHHRVSEYKHNNTLDSRPTSLPCAPPPGFPAFPPLSSLLPPPTPSAAIPAPRFPFIHPQRLAYFA